MMINIEDILWRYDDHDDHDPDHDDDDHDKS